MDCDLVKMSKCFFCGGEKNELVLLGDKSSRKDKNAWCNNKSMSVIANYEPCDNCQEEFSKGTLLIEASDTPNSKGQPEMQKDVYPTGRYWVINPDAINIDNPIAFVSEDAAKKMGLYEVEEDVKDKQNQ